MMKKKVIREAQWKLYFGEKTVMYREKEVVKGKGSGEKEIIMGGCLTFYMIETQVKGCDSNPSRIPVSHVLLVNPRSLFFL